MSQHRISFRLIAKEAARCKHCGFPITRYESEDRYVGGFIPFWTHDLTGAVGCVPYTKAEPVVDE